MLQPVGKHVEAGGELFVAVVESDVFAEATTPGKRSGERAEELTQLGSDGGVADLGRSSSPVGAR